MTDPAEPTADDPTPEPAEPDPAEPGPDDHDPAERGPDDRDVDGPADDTTSGSEPADRGPAGDAPRSGGRAGEGGGGHAGEGGGGRAGEGGGGRAGEGREGHAAGAAGRPDTPTSAASVDEPGEELPGSALAAVARGGGPPRPPKRTGVFVDHEDLRHYVGGLLRAILGGYEVDAFGNFTFAHEGARVFVTVGASPIGPQVGVFSVTNLDVDLTPDLAGFLLTTNHKLGFGSFSYDTDNRSVWLRHTLLGTTLDGPELQSAVAAVATTAAGLDHTIRDRFGGRTFADAPEQMQRGVEPPRPEDDPGPPNASGYL